MKLYLIRHGKTLANEQHLYCGSTDLPLSDNGIKELLSKKYTVPVKCKFITSGMLRTNQTLKILFGDVDYAIENAFREIDFGIFEMKSYEQLKDTCEYQQWISGDNDKNIPPEGESGSMVKTRVITALEQIVETDENAVIVTHGGVIALIMEHLFPGENKSRYQWQPKPGEGYFIENNEYLPIK